MANEKAKPDTDESRATSESESESEGDIGGEEETARPKPRSTEKSVRKKAAMKAELAAITKKIASEQGESSDANKRKDSQGETEEAAEDGEATFVPVVTIAEERSARRALAAGGTLSLVGLMLVGMGPSDAGMVVCLLGLVILIYGIHTFGRLGPELTK